jgi:hypothetical protein
MDSGSINLPARAKWYSVNLDTFIYGALSSYIFRAHGLPWQ